uniref:HMG box domain-containing protein n=1 Tax=Acrobeloides nanus TaxID=290746 RepID=A0A914EKE1_9BILA
MEKFPHESISRNKIIHESEKCCKGMEWEEKMQFLQKVEYDTDTTSNSAFETSVVKVKKAHRRKRKKVNLPRRPTRPYKYFYTESFDKVAAAHPEFKTGEYMSLMSKSIKELWNALSPEDCEKYVELFKKDKSRYNAEMKEFKEKGTFTPLGLDGKPKPSPSEPAPKKRMDNSNISNEEDEEARKFASLFF